MSVTAANPALPARSATRRVRLAAAWLPAVDAVLLVLGLAWTVAAKARVVRGGDAFAIDLLDALWADLAVFGFLAAAVVVVRLAPVAGLMLRLSTLIAAAYAGWAVLNAGWLLATGVQLQPGVLAVLSRAPDQFWPVVEAHLWHRPAPAVAAALTGLGAAFWLAYRIVRPRVPRWRPRVAIGAAVGWAALALACLFAQHRLHATGQLAYSSQVIGFSSHAYAATQLLADATTSGDVRGVARHLPRQGERDAPLTRPSDPPPNVVVIMLESVSHRVTSLAGSDRAATPMLERLAAEGVRFEPTRVPISMTSKAFWTVFTGSDPDPQPDNAEAVLADTPYESLASILGRHGYRSAFFEMSKGAFECAPGMFANLGFDWAWFRENLEDPSANLGYLNGDDFRMIEPMFEWVESSDEPFLLGMITSVAHDPFELPGWYEHEPADDRYERYLRTVEFTDAFVARVYAELAARGLLDRTVLCVIGDHGEGFRSGAKRGRWVPYEEVIRVPWVIRWPGGVEPGTRVDAPCSQLDVTPTLLALLGFDVNRAGFDGVNALERVPSDRTLYFSSWYDNSPFGFVQNARKYIYWPYNDMVHRYDLDNDPGEHEATLVDGEERDRVIERLMAWQSRTRMTIPAKRFREAFLFDHWQTFSSGRSAWAYYVPNEDGDDAP